jgi:diguanylate cyclase (GGDEF)-like protein
MVASAGPATPGDILIVDDTPANLRLLTQVLQNVGYRVRAVTSGRRALAAARAATPDLILLDVYLPDIDGFELCSLLKAEPITAGVPVIFISAMADPEAKVGAFAAGGVDYVTKPLHPDEILARVHTHLALRELHLQLQVANDALAERLSDLERGNQRLQAEIGARRAAEELSSRLLEQERRRVEQLHRLRAAMTDIGRALDLPGVQRAIAERAAGLLDASWAALAVAPDHGQPLQVRALAGLPPGLIGLEPQPGEGLVGLAAGLRRAVNSAEARTPSGAPVLGAGSALAAPLLADERLLGVVLVARPAASAPFDREDLQLLDLFAQQAASALEKARLFAELRQMASTDPLTGLINRRHFYEMAGRELERVRRSGGALAILMLDLDHFKLVNDAFGHQAGDEALRAVAEVLRTGLRTADVPARYGGEELVVLLPDADADHAAQAAERVRAAIAAVSVATERGEVQLTVSMGVAATCAGGAESLDQLLARADDALYAAKRQGRNCVVAWPAGQLARG